MSAIEGEERGMQMRDLFDFFAAQVQRERAVEEPRREEAAWQKEMRQEEDRAERGEDAPRKEHGDGFTFFRQTFRQRNQHRKANDFLREIMRERDSDRYLRLGILQQIGRDRYIHGTRTSQIYGWNPRVGLRNLITVLVESVHRHDRDQLTRAQFYAWFPADAQERPFGGIVGDAQWTQQLFAEADEYEARQRASALAQAFGQRPWNDRKAA